MPAKKLLLTTPYDINVKGGVNNHLWNLYQHLKEISDYQIKILAPSSAPSNNQNKDVITLGSITSLRANGSNSNLTLDLRIRKKVKSFFSEFKPDIIHLQEPLYPLLNHFVLNYSQAINVGTFHTYSSNPWGYRLAKPFLIKNFKKLHLKLAVSIAAKEFISKSYPGNYIVFPNGVTLEGKANKIRQLKADKKRVVLFVGRLDEPRKGFKYLIEAYKILELKYPETYQLWVVGSGNEQWKKNISSKSIRWMGRVSDDGLESLYDSADLLCAPSTGGESFGIIILEAFSHAIPIVCFNIKGYTELVRNRENGFIVENKNSIKLAQAIHTILSDKQLYFDMSQAALQEAKMFDWKLLAKEIAKLYDEILK